MPVNATDGRFAIECWTDADSEDEGQCEYGDDVKVLRSRAAQLLQLGHFGFIELTAYNFETGEWDVLDVFERDLA